MLAGRVRECTCAGSPAGARVRAGAFRVRERACGALWPESGGDPYSSPPPTPPQVRERCEGARTGGRPPGLERAKASPVPTALLLEVSLSPSGVR